MLSPEPKRWCSRSVRFPAVFLMESAVLTSLIFGQGADEEHLFIRGDANSDAKLAVSDALFILQELFLGMPVTCADASDANDNGTLEIADPVFILSYLFLGGPPPQLPYPSCGPDPTRDGLDCDAFAACKPFHTFQSDLGMTFVYLPPGEFEMGSPLTERGRELDDNGGTAPAFAEKIHHVILTHGFYMASTEVTQEYFGQVMNEYPSIHRGSSLIARRRLPVDSVTWLKAVEFCQRLTLREGMSQQGLEYRLPTEAEWEYASRAGTTTRFSFGEALDCRDDLDFFVECPQLVQYSIYGPNRIETVTLEVGVGLPNPWGIYDMHGNASEWCFDWLAPYPDGTLLDPAGPKVGKWKVVRGHSLRSVSRGRSAARSALSPDAGALPQGFRIVLGRIADRPVAVTVP